jgi:aminoglycoside 6'-N-acetyltransferase
MVKPELRGAQVVLVPVTPAHVPDLRRILHTPEVRRRWGDEAASVQWPFDDPSATRFAILLDGVVRGLVQYGEEEEPAYRHASIDIFLDPEVHGRGIGRDAVRTLPDIWCAIVGTTGWSLTRRRTTRRPFAATPPLAFVRSG